MLLRFKIFFFLPSVLWWVRLEGLKQKSLNYYFYNSFITKTLIQYYGIMISYLEGQKVGINSLKCFSWEILKGKIKLLNLYLLCQLWVIEQLGL